MSKKQERDGYIKQDTSRVSTTLTDPINKNRPHASWRMKRTRLAR